MPKLITYQDGVLVSVFDDRTVSATSAERIDAIKAQCAEAIEATGIAWMAQRELSGGAPIPQAVKDACAAYRARSNDLETQVNTIASGALSDDDKAACDAIETVLW